MSTPRRGPRGGGSRYLKSPYGPHTSVRIGHQTAKLSERVMLPALQRSPHNILAHFSERDRETERDRGREGGKSKQVTSRKETESRYRFCESKRTLTKTVKSLDRDHRSHYFSFSPPRYRHARPARQILRCHQVGKSLEEEGGR
eukprot:3674730-Rhodomonas_salina.1